MQVLKEIKIENNTELGPVVSSRAVAKELERTHKNVIRDLEQILESIPINKRRFYIVHVQHSRA